MTTIVPTTDGKWLLTYEYWGGGTNVRYRIADDPLKFYAPATPRSPACPCPRAGARCPTGGSPVLLPMPDGRIVYNAAGSGNVWVNESAVERRHLEGVPDDDARPVTAATSSTSRARDASLILQAAWSGGASAP